MNEPPSTLLRIFVAAAGEVILFIFGVFLPFMFLWSVATFMDWFHWSFGWSFSIVHFVVYGVPGILLGAVFAFKFRRRILGPRKISTGTPTSQESPLLELVRRNRGFRGVFLVLFLSYLLTWCFGVPDVISDITMNDVARAEEVADYYDEPMQAVYSEVSFAFPLVPGIVVAYHSHEGGRLHGWSGWKIYTWYIVDEKQLFEFARWVT